MSFLEVAVAKRSDPVKQFDLVFEIEGVDTFYASSTLLDYIRVGDAGLLVDGTWNIGGYTALSDQSDQPLLSLDDSTTTIASSVEPDEAKGTSVSFMKIGLIDRNQEITRLITPGEIVEDVLGRDAKVWIGFTGTLFKTEYLPIFRGLITDINAASGIIGFSLSSSEEKKRSGLFLKYEEDLTSPIDSLQTSIPVSTTNDFLMPITGPDATIDPSFKSYIEIDDEVMEVSSITSTTFNVTRGSLSTIPSSHSSGTNVSSLYIIEGRPIDLALKLMLSRGGDFYLEDVDITSIGTSTEGVIDPTVIGISNVYLILEQNVRANDYLTITGSVSYNGTYVISNIAETSDGTDIYLTGLSAGTPEGAGASSAFRSMYDVFPTDLSLKNDNVDIEKHEFYQSLFFPSIEFRFYIRDEVTGKGWLDDEIYKPCALYSLDRSGRASLAYHFPPLPGALIFSFNNENIKNPEKLAITRTINRNFYNTIIVKFDDSLTDTEFKRSVITVSSDSVSRLPLGSRALLINSRGLKDDLDGSSFSTVQSNRRLFRYQYGAEFFNQIDVFISDMFFVNIGDTVLMDGEGLSITDITNGTRDFDSRFMEVTERRLNILTGAASITLTDTGFSLENRYALMSPSSVADSTYSIGGSVRGIVLIDGSFHESSRSELLKWTKYITYNTQLLLRNEDYSQTQVLTLEGVDLTLGSIIVTEAITLTVTSGDYIVDLAPYDDQLGTLITQPFGWTTTTTFGDGSGPYRMI